MKYDPNKWEHDIVEKPLGLYYIYYLLYDIKVYADIRYSTCNWGISSYDNNILYSDVLKCENKTQDTLDKVMKEANTLLKLLFYETSK